MKRSIPFVLIAALSLFSAASFAGEPVKGSGPTRAAAADDADGRAKLESRRRFKREGCYTPARVEDCRKLSDGDYMCTAKVANHEGSCRTY